MVINWLKIIVICSMIFCLKFAGLLGYVRVLQIGEVYKYLGVDYEVNGEDKCIRL